MAGARGGRLPDCAGPPRADLRGATPITPFTWISCLLIWGGCTLASLRGGHAERFVAPFLLADQAITTATFHEPRRHRMTGASEVAVAGVFAWLASSSNRWQVLLAPPALLICVLASILEGSPSRADRIAAIPACTGLWMLVGCSPYGGVAERWPAGETQARLEAVWRRMGPVIRQAAA